jgi:hypothetical protein
LSLINTIRKRLFHSFLKQRIAKTNRLRKMVGLAGAEYIGIVFNASEEAHLILVKNFAAKLLEHNKKVKCLGYIDLKRRLDLPMSTLRFDFFTSKEMSWFYLPSTTVCESFMEVQFDLLLDLNIEADPVLQYIACGSKAKYKIGPANNPLTDADMTITVVDKKDFKGFFQNAVRYAEMIKPAKNE